MVRTIGKSRVVHPFDPGIIAQKLGHLSAVFHVPLHPQCYRLDSLQQQKSAQRRQDRSGRTLINAAAASKVRALAEMLGVDQAMVRRIWLAEGREARSVLFPGKIATINNGSSQRSAVPSHKLG